MQHRATNNWVHFESNLLKAGRNKDKLLNNVQKHREKMSFSAKKRKSESVAWCHVWEIMLKGIMNQWALIFIRSMEKRKRNYASKITNYGLSRLFVCKIRKVIFLLRDNHDYDWTSQVLMQRLMSGNHKLSRFSTRGQVSRQ